MPPPDPDQTGTLPAPPYVPPRVAPGERFPPGTYLAGRYRVVAQLGKGGMGEVFRADDLTLGQPVALKFLPPELASDPGRLDGFRKEVAAARRVSHPNVCRVYDIADHSPGGGLPPVAFLTMEFIDGEDLASLLKRVGRLSEEKGVEIARQLCSALAAVHDAGLLHRDLKPANIMLDGRGRVRLTDFGLAAAESELSGVELRFGTPLYMAPEQAAGREVTARSDLFSLGLVLYELFTGKRAFPDAGRDTAPSPVSSHVGGLDIRVERVVAKCLEPDPAARPASAAEVLALLPGGDPLAEARAAGVTPSPELVAAAGGSGILSPAAGGLLLAALAVGLVAFLALYDRVMLVGMVGLPEPADALSRRARDVFHLAGLPDRADAVGFDHDQKFLAAAPVIDPDAGWRERVRRRPAAPIYFWCRQAPGPMLPDLFYPYTGSVEPGRVTWSDPTPLVPGMAGVKLDTRGRLLEFVAVPPDRDAAVGHPPGVPGPDVWRRWFEAADLDFARFTPATPAWVPPVYADHRTAWEGTTGDPHDLPIRVEAATYRGRVVGFQLVTPWTVRDTGEQTQGIGGQGSSVSPFLLFIFVLMIILVLAPANLRAGRADTAGAFRIGAMVFCLQMVVWAFETPHQFAGVAALRLEVRSVVMGLAFALYWAALLAGSYLALEPLVRRLWPQAVISWTRLLSGRPRDPLVGRDLLVGVLGGVLLVVVGMLGNQAPAWSGGSANTPWWDWWTPNTRVPGYWVGNLLINLVYSFRTTFFYSILVYLLLREVLRKPWLAGTAYVALWSVVNARDLGLTAPTPTWAFLVLANLLMLGLLTRFGALAIVAATFVSNCLWFPISLDPASGYAGTGFVILAMVVGLAGYGFYTATGGGRPAANAR